MRTHTHLHIHTHTHTHTLPYPCESQSHYTPHASHHFFLRPLQMWVAITWPPAWLSHFLCSIRRKSTRRKSFAFEVILSHLHMRGENKKKITRHPVTSLKPGGIMASSVYLLCRAPSFWLNKLRGKRWKGLVENPSNLVGKKEIYFIYILYRFRFLFSNHSNTFWLHFPHLWAPY